MRADAASRRALKHRVQLGVLGVLLVIVAITSMQAWHAWANVKEGERLFLLADTQSEQGKTLESLATLDRVLALNPLHFPSYELKSLQLLQLGQKDKALAALQSALDYIDDDARIHVALGEFYLMNQHDPVNAQRELQRACQIDPNDLQARRMLGFAARAQASKK